MQSVLVHVHVLVDHSCMSAAPQFEPICVFFPFVLHCGLCAFYHTNADLLQTTALSRDHLANLTQIPENGSVTSVVKLLRVEWLTERIFIVIFFPNGYVSVQRTNSLAKRIVQTNESYFGAVLFCMSHSHISRRCVSPYAKATVRKMKKNDLAIFLVTRQSRDAFKNV